MRLKHFPTAGFEAFSYWRYKIKNVSYKTGEILPVNPVDLIVRLKPDLQVCRTYIRMFYKYDSSVRDGSSTSYWKCRTSGMKRI